MNTENIIIIGGGVAGLTAGIYTARAGLQPLVIEGFSSGGQAGGQLMTTTEVENFPGFHNGISGPELINNIKQQALKFGTRIVTEDVISLDAKSYPFIVQTSSNKYQSYSIIIATGASARILDNESVKKFWGKGVSACATCDGPMPVFRNQPLAVVGGGDTAMEEALFLTRFACKVYIIHRRSEFRASKVMLERAKSHPKIEFIIDSIVDNVYGDNMVKGITIKNVKTNETKDIEIKGLFLAIGHEPNTKFLQNQIHLDEKGYIIVNHPHTYTSVEGIFACGDVTDPHYRQAITAAGSGCKAAIDAERWLASKIKRM